MSKKKLKTNAMRILEEQNISYTEHTYFPGKNHIDGITVAKLISKKSYQVFKTLVTKSNGNNFFVFILPVEHTLNMKKAAKACNEKKIEMIHVNDINRITGYVRGGCSPIGMKKPYDTFIDKSAENLESMIVSGGKIGYQIELTPLDLMKITKGKFEKLT